MASAQKAAPRSNSRWNFISQAVASVESRLDTILGDEEVPSRNPTPQPLPAKENIPPPRASTESARASNATNDRLQERLARAMAKKNASKVDSPIVSEPTSRTATPDASPAPGATDTLSTQGAGTLPVQVHLREDVGQQESTRMSHEEETAPESLDAEPASLRLSKDLLRVSQEKLEPSGSTDEADAALLHAQLEHEDIKTKMQDEIRGYIERIDGLNAKLQYLTREAAGSAKQHAADSGSGSLEKKLFEKDEKIALLMEEGQKLSMNEMKHLTTIKRLRAQTSTSNKDHDAVKQRAERAERAATGLDERIKRAEANARNMETKLAEASKTIQDLEAVTREKVALNETLVEMRTQVAKANARAESAESKVRAEQVDLEARRITELQDDLSSAKIERGLAEEKLLQEIKDLKSALEREKGQTRAMETEMLAEQVTLESKLESFRVRAEEASSNDQGDAQAKLLRQIETLQSQYAAASQNWQGIEGSLLARITTLQKERDELSTRETDVRRKLKDATTRAKRMEKDLEDLQLEYATEQEAQSNMQAENQRLSRRTQHLEEESARSQKEVEDQKVKMERDYARRLDDERSRWAASVQLARTASPSVSNHKSSAYDTNHLVSPYSERPTSRRSSMLNSALASADFYPPSRHHSTTSSRSIHNGIPETPILITSDDPDEYFAGIPAAPISPDNAPSRRGVADLISTSTVGAGPSVQLVERMSANVRRLESEKAASKDELARLTVQRDESRQEVVRLMREVEQKRGADHRLTQLEDEHKVLNERYQTTLELLGEKSEQVEELKADIMDVKQMYRDLAEHMK